MELVALGRVLGRPIDFFPPRPDPERLGELGSICIATKSRTIGDALCLSTLAGKLRAKFPGLRVHTYPRGFNPVVARGNPAVSGVARLPRAVFGDDANWGGGHLIQQKERFFGLEASDPPKPEIHLLDGEKSWARNEAGPDDRPICVIHPWGGTRSRVLSIEDWERVVTAGSGRFRFWQAGLEGHPRIRGCEKYCFVGRAPHEARKLFSWMSVAHAFIGVDSGPMHVARAFGVASLVVIDHLEGFSGFEEVFSLRRDTPYFLRGLWKYSFLYEENTHVMPGPRVVTQAGEFLAKNLA